MFVNVLRIRVFLIRNTFQTTMSSSGEKNSYGQKKNASWKSHKTAFTFKSKDIVVLEDDIKLPSTNLLGADARGTMLRNSVDLVDTQHDDPPHNLQQSTSPTTKVVCNTRKCTHIDDSNWNGYKCNDPRSQKMFLVHAGKRRGQRVALYHKNVTIRNSKIKKRFKNWLIMRFKVKL